MTNINTTKAMNTENLHTQYAKLLTIYQTLGWNDSAKEAFDLCGRLYGEDFRQQVKSSCRNIVSMQPGILSGKEEKKVPER